MGNVSEGSTPSLICAPGRTKLMITSKAGRNTAGYVALLNVVMRARPRTVSALSTKAFVFHRVHNDVTLPLSFKHTLKAL